MANIKYYLKKILYSGKFHKNTSLLSERQRQENKQDKRVCSDRILTFGIRSIRSPAKVGLVVTELLITSPVLSWRGWETPPPPPSTADQLSFFAQPLRSEDLSLPWWPALRLHLCLRFGGWIGVSLTF